MTREWWAAAACSRKKRYAYYGQAKAVLEKMRERGDMSPTLHVYRCDFGNAQDPHYHLGNATGREAKRLIKRAEKQRRKALWKSDVA